MFISTNQLEPRVSGRGQRYPVILLRICLLMTRLIQHCYHNRKTRGVKDGKMHTVRKERESERERERKSECKKGSLYTELNVDIHVHVSFILKMSECIIV